MRDQIAEWNKELAKPRSVPFLEQFSDYLKGLSMGDRFIAGMLGVLVVIAALGTLYSLEQSLLIQVPAYGGTLTEGVVGSPRFINPLLAISDADRDLTALTYAGLMGISGDGSLKPVLAESYSVSPDSKTYTFVLRDDAVFSDGTTVAADDVVFTIQKAQDPAIKSPEYADWSGVSVTAIDARTIKFTLSKPYAPFLQNTTLGILPAHLWRTIPDEQFPFSSLAIEPVGAGPFKVSNVSRDKTGLITNYTVSRFDHYVLGAPYLDSVHLQFFAQQDDLVMALTKGSIDSAYGIPQKDALTAPYARVFGVFFNPSQNALFARLEVRKALSLVIDRDTIVRSVLGGYATALTNPIPPGSGIVPTPVQLGGDLVRSAADTLTAGGWIYDGTARLWENAAAKLSLDPITIKTSNVPELKAVATEVKKDWEKLGVQVDIELYEPGDLNQNVIRPRKYEALLFGMVIGRDQDLYAFWDSAERNDPGLNIALYANKTVDALLEDARQTGDVGQHKADLQKISDTVAADYPAAFTHAPSFIYDVPKDLRGVMLPQITTPSDRFASVADWYLRTESVWPFLVLTK